MDGKSILTLAVDFAAGGITAAAIQEQYGEGVLGSVLAIAGGSLVGTVTNSVRLLVEN